MNLQEMEKYLRGQEQAKAKTHEYRYTNTVLSVAGFPDVFGLNFGALMQAKPEELAGIYLAQEQRANLVRKIMAGKEVTDEELQNSFGFTKTELDAYRSEKEPVRKEIPSQKLCVLTFDDAMKSQYETALPILKELGFHATFFIAEKEASPMGPGFEDKSVYMTWEQIREIAEAGFEIGNHSWHHIFGSQNMGHDFNVNEIRKMEEELEAHGIKKPISYAYPSGISNEEVVAVARECGYKWARGNEEKGENDGYRGMTYYDPHVDSPLAIANFGDPDFYTEELLLQRLEDCPDGMIFGLTYHDVSEEKWPGSCPFKRQMEILKEQGVKVISIADLEEYIDPEKAYQYTI